MHSANTRCSAADPIRIRPPRSFTRPMPVVVHLLLDILHNLQVFLTRLKTFPLHAFVHISLVYRGVAVHVPGDRQRDGARPWLLYAEGLLPELNRLGNHVDRALHCLELVRLTPSRL